MSVAADVVTALELSIAEQRTSRFSRRSGNGRPSGGERTSGDAFPPSEYAALMPVLHWLCALDPADPRRPGLRAVVITGFLPVVDHLARSRARGQADVLDELVQVGRCALIKAVDAWDPDKTRGEFLGYLIPCVRGEMLHWFRDLSPVLRVPRPLVDLVRRIDHATGPLSQQLGRAPRPSELATHLDVDLKKVIEALDARYDHEPMPIDGPHPLTGLPLVDQLGDLDPVLEQISDRHVLRPLLAALPERDRRILVLRFFHERSQAQIAVEIGISQMQVSRILARTLGRLRRRLTAGDDGG